MRNQRLRAWAVVGAVVLLAGAVACGRARVVTKVAEGNHFAEVSGVMLVAIGDPPDGGEPSLSLTIVEAGGRARRASLGTGVSLDRSALERLNGRFARWRADTGDGSALVLHRLVEAKVP